MADRTALLQASSRLHGEPLVHVNSVLSSYAAALGSNVEANFQDKSETTSMPRQNDVVENDAQRNPTARDTAEFNAIPRIRPVPVIVTTRGSGAGFQSEVSFPDATPGTPAVPSAAYSDSKCNLDADKLPSSIAYIGRPLPAEVDINHTTATLTFVLRLDSIVNDDYFLDSASDEKLRNAFNAASDGGRAEDATELSIHHNAAQPITNQQQKLKARGSAVHMLSANDIDKRAASAITTIKPDAVANNTGRRSLTVSQKFGDLAFLSNESVLKPEATVHLEYELLPVPVAAPLGAGLSPHGLLGGSGRDSALGTVGGGLARRGSDAPAGGSFIGNNGVPPRDAIKTRNCSVDIISFGHIAKIYAYAASHTPFIAPATTTRLSLPTSAGGSTPPNTATGNVSQRTPAQQCGGGASSVGVGGTSPPNDFLTKAVFAWREKGCTFIAFTIEHSVRVTTDDLKQLRTHQCEVRVWTDKEKMNVRTKTEINRGKKVLFESMFAPSVGVTTGGSSINLSAKPGSAKESSSGHHMSTTLGVNPDTVLATARPSGMMGGFEDWSAVEQRFVSSHQCRRLAEAAYAHYCASLPKFARSSVAPLIAERTKNVRINAEDKKRHHHGDDTEKGGRGASANKSKRSSGTASPAGDNVSPAKPRKAGKSSAPSGAVGGGKGGKQQPNADAICSMRMNMAKFFSPCRSHVVRMSPSSVVNPEQGTPVLHRQQQQTGRGHTPAQSLTTETSIYDLMLQITMSDPLLNDFQNQSLIPLVLTVECVKNMPDIPNDFATLHDSCTPAYIQYQLFTDNEDPGTAANVTEPVHRSSPAIRQTRNMIIDDTYVVLVGLKDKEKIKECLLGPPLEVAVHDRDMLGRKPLTNSFGIAQFDLSVVLNTTMQNRNEILRVSAPVHANIPGYNDWTKLVGKPEVRENAVTGGGLAPPGVFEEGDDASGGGASGALTTGGGGKGARLTVGSARNRGGAKSGSARAPSTHGPNSGGGHGGKHDQQRLTEVPTDGNNADGVPAASSSQAIQLLPAGLYLESDASVKISLSTGWPLQQLMRYGPPTKVCIFDRIIVKFDYHGERSLRVVQQIDAFVTRYNIHSLHIDAESKNFEVQQALLKAIVIVAPDTLQQTKGQMSADGLLPTSSTISGQLGGAAKTKSSAQLVYHPGVSPLPEGRKKGNRNTTTSTIVESASERESAMSKAAESSADALNAAAIAAAHNSRPFSEDVITGFALHDSHVHLVILEARYDGASGPLREFVGQLMSTSTPSDTNSSSATSVMKKRSSKQLASSSSKVSATAAVRKNTDDVVVLFDSRLRHSRRLYCAFGAHLEQTVVKRSLTKLMKEPVLYLTHSVPTLALTTLYKLDQLLTSCNVPRDAVQRGLFPSAEGWRQFKLHFCQLHISQPMPGDGKSINDAVTNKADHPSAHFGKQPLHVAGREADVPARGDAEPVVVPVNSHKSILKHGDTDRPKKVASKTTINADDRQEKPVLPLTASQLLLRQRRATGAILPSPYKPKTPLLRFKRRRIGRPHKNFLALNVAHLRKLERSERIVRKRGQIEKMKPKRLADHPLFHNRNGGQLAHYALYALQPMRTVRRMLRARMRKLSSRSLYEWSLDEKIPRETGKRRKIAYDTIDRKVLRPFILSCPSEVIQKIQDEEAKSACYQRIFFKQRHSNDDPSVVREVEDVE